MAATVETIEGIRLVKDRLLFVKTVLGISNVSFGLPAAAREVVNSVFLYYCTKAGLDLAIVNAEKLERFASIPEEERRLAENLLFNRRPGSPRKNAHGARGLAGADGGAGSGDQPVSYRGGCRAFSAGGSASEGEAEDLPLNTRLANYIIEGVQGRTDRGPGPEARRGRGAAGSRSTGR